MNILPHNEKAYKAVKRHLKTSNRTCVVHPTGTGKSVIALSLIADNRKKRILYITSYAANLLEFWDKVDALGGYRMVLNLSNPAKHVGTDTSAIPFTATDTVEETDVEETEDVDVEETEDAAVPTIADEEERIRLLKKATEVDESFLTGPLHSILFIRWS